MKIRLLLCLFMTFILILSSHPQQTSAQGLRIIASNTVLGALNGAMLGGASMALANDDDWRPMRFGVGFGTLGGLGLGIYDFAKAGSGTRSVQGVFNSANYTTQIILQDTFYGAVIGTLVGMAVTLIIDERVVYGLQYGVGAGTWAGFAFGMVDVFAIDQGPREYRYEDFDDYSSSPVQQSGMLQMKLRNSHSIGFGDLTFTLHPDPESGINRMVLAPVLTVASWQFSF
jgi:hypothetical protein